jgi:hypothetical protein
VALCSILGRKPVRRRIGACGRDLAWIPLRDSGGWTFDHDPGVTIDSLLIKSGPLLGDLTLAVEYRFRLMPDLIWPIDAGSDGPNLSVPLRRVLLSKEPPTFLGINPQSTTTVA